MSKVSLTVIASLVFLGAGLLIAGVATPGIIKLCNADGTSSNPTSLGLASHSVTVIAAGSPSGPKICIQQGLFFVGIQSEGDHLLISTPLERREKSILLVSVLLLVGVVGTTVVEAIFIVAACNAVERDMKFTLQTSKRNFYGTFVLAVSLIFLVSGLAVYTHQKSKAIGNSTLFFRQVISATTGVQVNMNTTQYQEDDMQNLFPTLQPLLASADFVDDSFNVKDVPERLATQDTPITTFNLNQSSGSDATQNYSNLSDSLPADSLAVVASEEKRKKRSPGPATAMPSIYTIVRTLASRGLYPTFGYSFYLSWTGAFVLFVALIWGVALKIKERYSTRITLINARV